VIPEPALIGAEIFAGMLVGIAEQDNLPQLAECFYEFDEFVYDIITAWNMIASETMAGMMNGAILAMSAIMYLPHDALECIKARTDMKAFEQWLAQIGNPKELGLEIKYNIRHHFAKLTLLMNQARKDFAYGEFAHFGEVLGEMVMIVTTPIPTEPGEKWLEITVTEE
jgi:hypothetical protein